MSKTWNKSTTTCVSNFPCLFFFLQPRPFSPPIHSSSPPPIAPLARAESTSSISSTNSLSAATTPTVGKNYLLSFNPFIVLTGCFLWSENLKALYFWLKLFCSVFRYYQLTLLLKAPSQQRRQNTLTKQINKQTKKNINTYILQEFSYAIPYRATHKSKEETVK